MEDYLPPLAPADADWTDAEVLEYLRRRERIQLDRLDGLSDGEVQTLEEQGFSRQELAELRDLTDRYYTRLKDNPTAGRTNMDVSVVPMVLITGSVPEHPA